MFQVFSSLSSSCQLSVQLWSFLFAMLRPPAAESSATNYLMTLVVVVAFPLAARFSSCDHAGESGITGPLVRVRYEGGIKVVCDIDSNYLRFQLKICGLLGFNCPGRLNLGCVLYFEIAWFPIVFIRNRKWISSLASHPQLKSHRGMWTRFSPACVEKIDKSFITYSLTRSREIHSCPGLETVLPEKLTRHDPHPGRRLSARMTWRASWIITE